MKYIAVKFAFKTMVSYFLLFDKSFLPDTLVGFWHPFQPMTIFWYIEDLQKHLLVSFGFCHVYIQVVFIFFLSVILLYWGRLYFYWHKIVFSRNKKISGWIWIKLYADFFSSHKPLILITVKSILLNPHGLVLNGPLPP